MRKTTKSEVLSVVSYTHITALKDENSEHLVAQLELKHMGEAFKHIWEYIEKIGKKNASRNDNPKPHLEICVA